MCEPAVLRSVYCYLFMCYLYIYCHHIPLSTVFLSCSLPLPLPCTCCTSGSRFVNIAWSPQLARVMISEISYLSTVGLQATKLKNKPEAQYPLLTAFPCTPTCSQTGYYLGIFIWVELGVSYHLYLVDDILVMSRHSRLAAELSMHVVTPRLLDSGGR